MQDYDGKDVKFKGGHGPDKKRWRDLVPHWLYFYTYEDLQIIEAYTDNEYIRQAARIILLTIHNQDLGEPEKTLIKRR